MSSRSDYFLKKTLGDDFFESLNKFELWKPGTRTTIDHEEIKTAFQIVPRIIMSILIRELSPMEIGQSKEFDLDINQSNPGDAKVKVNKHERDVYSGTVEQNNKVLVDFKYRSLPGVGLVIMSALELYDVNQLGQPSPEIRAPAEVQVQKMIEDRMSIHALVNEVVDKKISERDAMKQMFLMRLTEELGKAKAEAQKIRDDINNISSIAKDSAGDEDYLIGMANGVEVAKAIVNKTAPEFIEPKKKGSPLKKFIEDRKNKLKKNEFAVKMVKGECVNCEDCGKNIFDGTAFAGCVCLGDDMSRKVFIKKTEEGIKIRFGRGWDKENIEMLLETLRRRNDRK